MPVLLCAKKAILFSRLETRNYSIENDEKNKKTHLDWKRMTQLNHTQNETKKRNSSKEVCGKRAEKNGHRHWNIHTRHNMKTFFRTFFTGHAYVLLRLQHCCGGGGGKASSRQTTRKKDCVCVARCEFMYVALSTSMKIFFNAVLFFSGLTTPSQSQRYVVSD